MVQERPLTSNAIESLIKRIDNTAQQQLAKDWNQAMANGAVCYGRPIGLDTRRLYLNAARKFWQYLKDDYSNLYQAVVKAIEDHRSEQFSSRKHCKEAAISLAKYLIYRKEGDDSNA
jgi:hypothetical protein